MGKAALIQEYTFCIPTLDTTSFRTIEDSLSLSNVDKFLLLTGKIREAEEENHPKQLQQHQSCPHFPTHLTIHPQSSARREMQEFLVVTSLFILFFVSTSIVSRYTHQPRWLLVGLICFVSSLFVYACWMASAAPAMDPSMAPHPDWTIPLQPHPRPPPIPISPLFLTSLHTRIGRSQRLLAQK